MTWVDPEGYGAHGGIGFNIPRDKDLLNLSSGNFLRTFTRVRNVSLYSMQKSLKDRFIQSINHWPIMA